MKFVAPEQAPEQAEIIRNTPFWPDVDLSEFRSVMRTDGTVTQPRLKQVALSAISEVNAELYEFRRRQQMLGYASLAEVPAEQLDGKSERIQHYFNAVYCWARAMLNERYQDYEAGQPFLVAFVEPFVAGLILLFHFHIPHGDITGSRMPPAGRRLRLLRVNG